MSPAKFVFGLQPKLDQSLELKRLAEGLLSEAMNRRAESLLAREAAEKKLEIVTQQLRAAREYLTGRTPPDPSTDCGLEVIEGGRFAAAMESVRSSSERNLSQADEALAESDRMVGLRRQELAEAMRAVETFEKLRNRQFEEFKLEMNRSEESHRDDATILAWNQRRASEERRNEG